jgi:hypothetical protein
MPLAQPRDSTIAVVGDGFGSALVYATAVYLGFRPEQLTVYGPADRPSATYQQYAFNLGQTVLRSESESHFLPADWPTFAQLDAWSRRSLAPLGRSFRRRYNPGVPDVMAELAAVGTSLGWDASRYPERIGWIQRDDGPVPHFVLYDEEARYAGRAKHVILAIGHGPLAFPPALAKARQDPALVDRVVQAYEPKRYASGGRYIVIGAGIASVNEWANALEAGGKVIALLRSPVPDEQDLNTPRCQFESLGIDAFQGLSFDQRLEFLAKILKGASPERRGWAGKVRQGRAEGRFDQLMGEIDEVRPGPAGLRVHISSGHGPDPGWLDVTGVVAGTGFARSALTVPLLRRLVQLYQLPVEHGRMVLSPNCGVAGLDRPESRLAVMGIHADPVVPNGDTITGLKYVARRFVADVAGAERLPRRSFASRMSMQLALASASAEAIRQVRHVGHIAPAEQPA